MVLFQEKQITETGLLQNSIQNNICFDHANQNEKIPEKRCNTFQIKDKR